VPGAFSTEQFVVATSTHRWQFVHGAPEADFNNCIVHLVLTLAQRRVEQVLFFERSTSTLSHDAEGGTAGSDRT
jgi:hypothetical protein